MSKYNDIEAVTYMLFVYFSGSTELEKAIVMQLTTIPVYMMLYM